MTSLMISLDDYFWFVDEALDGMVAIATELGDGKANRRPDIPGANSPYVILHHCLGVMDYWGGHVIAGRPTDRDRDAEFTASGPVDELVRRAEAARDQLREDLRSLDPDAPPRNPPANEEDAALPLGRTQGGAAFHIYEELAQHRGQMEGARDVLLAPWRS
jgi:hypothetical protein